MQGNDLNIQKFLEERESDIKQLEKSISSSRKKTMLFQRLPYYKRRRNRSNFVKKKVNRRNPSRFLTRTHVWYAKRFKMIKISAYSIPYKRNIKSSKYIYKSLERGFIFDESFKKVYKCRLISNNHLKTNEIYLIRSRYGNIEYYLTDTHLNVLLWDAEYMEDIIEEIRDDKLLQIDNRDITVEPSFIISVITNKEYNHPNLIRNRNKYEYGKIRLEGKDVMDTWNTLIRQGYIPVCILELQRIALENKRMLVNFDDVNSDFYKAYEESVNREIIEKYERTPKGKKNAIRYEDMVIYTDKEVCYYIFEVIKGNLGKNAFIYELGDIIGRVIRGEFCYTRGKCMGLAYLYKETSPGSIYEGNNYDQEVRYNIKIIGKPDL